MTPGLGARFGRLPACDRLQLLVVAAVSVAGTILNYLRGRGATRQPELFWTAIGIWAAIAAVAAYAILRQRRGLAAYGFTFKTGGLVSLAVIALIYLYLLITGKPILPATDNLVLRAAGAFLEELAFRVMAIDSLLLLMDGIPGKGFRAILVSSALFLLPHIPSKPLGQLPGLFLGAMLLGYIYYKSRSIALPAWVHATGNAGFAGGLFITAAYCVIALVGYAVRPVKSLAAARAVE